jgi:hypothetical protein
VAAAKDFHTWSPGVAVIDQRGPELWNATGANTALRQQLRTTFADIGKIGLPDGVVAQIADAHVDALLAGSRVMNDDETDAAAVALERQIQANNVELREQFAKRYGPKDGEQLLERTQRFVRSHPKLAAILKENGIGSRIDIVEAIAGHVFSNGIR